MIRRSPRQRAAIVAKLQARETRALERANYGWGPRPKTRADCCNGPRPCPWVLCRYHLLLDVNQEGGLRLHIERGKSTEKRTLRATRDSTYFPGWSEDALKRLHELPATCALDVAEGRDGITFQQIGEIFGVTREGARGLAETVLAAVRERLEQ